MIYKAASLAPEFSEENPFWNFSLEIYARTGVAEACLALQNEFGVDVNMVLYCVWLADQGRALDDAAAGDCIAITHPWQTRMVSIIRELGRACRNDSLLAPEAFRESIRRELARVELHAERIEQELLLAFSIGTARGVPSEERASLGSSGSRRSPASAEGNMANYFAAAGIVMNERSGELIDRILAAAT
jgi:uncharacterized protein (TIGR02444 family)